MTVSTQQRQADINRALTVMVERIGDGYLTQEFFDASDTTIAMLPTTWVELEQHGLVDPKANIGSAEFALTASGWFEGVRLSGRLGSPDVRDRVIRIKVALQRLVKGRAEKAFLDEQELSPDVGIPPGWIYNALRSGLLSEFFPNQKVDVEYTVHDDFRVPTTFGLERL